MPEILCPRCEQVIIPKAAGWCDGCVNTDEGEEPYDVRYDDRDYDDSLWTSEDY